MPQRSPAIIGYLAIAFLCAGICGLSGFLFWLMTN